MPYLIFLAGLCIGSLLTKKTHVVVVDKGVVAAEVNHEGTVLVLKDGANMEVRKVRANKETVKEAVVDPDGGRFYQDSWGDWSVTCKTCAEDRPLPLEESVWESHEGNQGE